MAAWIAPGQRTDSVIAGGPHRTHRPGGPTCAKPSSKVRENVVVPVLFIHRASTTVVVRLVTSTLSAPPPTVALAAVGAAGTIRA